ncbi:Protein MEI2-like 1 [Symbiodinium microadriaticum]|uniref:Protein MEI2-like 1 n=1 Tax=Symbiodinium microadriaticum TaxID=2951 RepID=A0A1Q9C397_SYMMI|nr:Protein MEI2-like 1 [Symbiodinium microadriaticum]
MHQTDMRSVYAQALWHMATGGRTEEDGVISTLGLKNSFLHLSAFDSGAQKTRASSHPPDRRSLGASPQLTKALAAEVAEIYGRDMELPRISRANTEESRCRSPVREEATEAKTGSVQAETPVDQTSMVLRNIPKDLNRTGLCSLLDVHGCFETANFIYLPARFKDGLSLGYAFINFHTPEAAMEFQRKFHGMQLHPPGALGCANSAPKPMVVHPNVRMRSLEELLHRYKNSPILHPDVPEPMKPFLLDHGKPMPFPPQTEHVESPEWLRPRHRHPPGPLRQVSSLQGCRAQSRGQV